MSRRTSPRGAYRRSDCVFVGAWIPKAWIPTIDATVAALDLDRSKLLRKAVADALLKARSTEPA